MKFSIAPVVCLTKLPDGSMAVKLVDGSGFFVDRDGVFVTASHVVSDFVGTSLSCDAAAIYLPQDSKWPKDGVLRNNFRWYAFVPTACFVDTQMDLAVCKTALDPVKNKDVVTVPVQLDVDLVADGTDIAFTGFPLKTPIPRTARGSVSGYGSVNGETFEMVIDKTAWPGASGSPVYLIDGRVVGIILARGTEDAAGLAFARTSNVIKRFLDESREKGGPNKQ